jgi:hypothetical protein
MAHEHISTDPAHDPAVRVNTATLLIVDPCELAHEYSFLARLVEDGRAVLVALNADGQYPVVVNEENDIEVWCGAADEDAGPTVFQREEGRDYLLELGDDPGASAAQD